MTAEAATRALTLGEALASATARLAAHGIESARTDARLLVQHALGLDRNALLVERGRILATEELAAIDSLLARRAAREPVSRIIGRREFWSLDFALSPAALDPRPDSETLIEAALDLMSDRSAQLRVLDLGTGTGCLLLALLSELPNAWGVGVDISPAAVYISRMNAACLGLDDRTAFFVGDWTTALADGVSQFNLILANPPYVADAELAELSPEVACFDPMRALAGGTDGLSAYRALVPELPGLLAPGGHALLEVGAGQAAAVAALLRSAGLAPVATRRDLSGIDRCVTGQKKFGIMPIRR